MWPFKRQKPIYDIELLEVVRGHSEELERLWKDVRTLMGGFQRIERKVYRDESKKDGENTPSEAELQEVLKRLKAGESLGQRTPGREYVAGDIVGDDALGEYWR